MRQAFIDEGFLKRLFKRRDWVGFLGIFTGTSRLHRSAYSSVSAADAALPPAREIGKVARPRTEPPSPAASRGRGICLRRALPVPEVSRGGRRTISLSKCCLRAHVDAAFRKDGEPHRKRRGHAGCSPKDPEGAGPPAGEQDASPQERADFPSQQMWPLAVLRGDLERCPLPLSESSCNAQAQKDAHRLHSAHGVWIVAGARPTASRASYRTAPPPRKPLGQLPKKAHAPPHPTPPTGIHSPDSTPQITCPSPCSSPGKQLRHFAVAPPPEKAALLRPSPGVHASVVCSSLPVSGIPERGRTTLYLCVLVPVGLSVASSWGGVFTYFG